MEFKTLRFIADYAIPSLCPTFAVQSVATGINNQKIVLPVLKMNFSEKDSCTAGICYLPQQYTEYFEINLILAMLIYV